MGTGRDRLHYKKTKKGAGSGINMKHWSVPAVPMSFSTDPQNWYRLKTDWQMFLSPDQLVVQMPLGSNSKLFHFLCFSSHFHLNLSKALFSSEVWFPMMVKNIGHPADLGSYLFPIFRHTQQKLISWWLLVIKGCKVKKATWSNAPG